MTGIGAYAIALLVAGLIVAIYWLFRGRGHVKARLREVAAITLEWSPDTDGESHAKKVLRGWVHPIGKVALRGDNRFLLREPRTAVLAELTASGRPAGVGALFTGVALLCTFVLIGYVLTGEVHRAIASFSGGEEADAAKAMAQASDSLASAVANMGAKFYISATGVCCSVIYAVFVLWAESDLNARVEAAEREMRHVFASPDEYDGLVQRLHLDALVHIQETLVEGSRHQREEAARLEASTQRIDQRLEPLVGMATVLERTSVHAFNIENYVENLRNQSTTALRLVSEVGAKLEKLQSIEVSVQNIGAEVMAQVQHMLTKDLGDQIKEMMMQGLEQVAVVAGGLGEQVTGALQKAIETELPQIKEHLDNIRLAVQQQASSPVEQILERLQGSLAAGYKGESAQVGVALKQLADVVPGLAMQLQETSTRMGQDLAQQQRSGAETMGAVMSKLEGLLVQLAQQQEGVDRAVAAIGTAAASATAGLTGAVKDETAALVERFGTSARAQLEAMAQQASAVNNASGSALQRAQQSLDGAATALAAAEGSLSSSSKIIQSVASEGRALFEAARVAGEGTRSAAGHLTSQSVSLREMLAACETVLKEAREQGNTERQLTLEHRQVLQRLEEMWPRLFDRYLQSFDDKSSRLASSWSEYFDKVQKLADSAAGPLNEAAEELASSVRNLADLAKGRAA